MFSMVSRTGRNFHHHLKNYSDGISNFLETESENCYMETRLAAFATKHVSEVYVESTAQIHWPILGLERKGR